VDGGWNCLLGLAGLQLFRATDRFSIWILALVLLFLMRRLGRISLGWSPVTRTGTAILLCAVAIVDQAPPAPRRSALKATEAIMDSDKGLVAKLAQALPGQSMIFQLPVVDFPENPPIVNMADYEHLRPYLFSSTLRYSYGTNKGRETDFWQHETGNLKPAAMIARLEDCGFAAIWINRSGYRDKAKALVAGLRDAGRGDVLESARGDLVCVLLHPSPHPKLPNPLVEFGSGWYDTETDPASGETWRWSSGNAEIDVTNNSPVPLRMNISFEISSSVRQRLAITGGNNSTLEIGSQPREYSGITELQPGTTRLLFRSDVPATIGPGVSDPRKLGFMLKNISIDVQRPP
jgi:hypothetical protein